MGRSLLTEQEFVLPSPGMRSRPLHFAKVHGVCHQHVFHIHVTLFGSVLEECSQERLALEGEVFGQHKEIQEMSSAYRLCCLPFVPQLFCSRARTNFCSLSLYLLNGLMGASLFLLFPCNFRYIIGIGFNLHVIAFFCDDCNFL